MFRSPYLPFLPRALVVLAAVLAPFTAPVALAQEADALLSRAATALGTNTLDTLQYSGRGMGASFGQAFVPGMPWPKLNYVSYERRIDYRNAYIYENINRSRAEPKGGGAVPLDGAAAAATAASADRAWNFAGPNAVPRQAGWASRQHDLLVTPHGVIKAAQKNKSTLEFRNVGGKSLAAVSFTVPAIAAVTAFINDDYLVERVESRIPDHVLGDTPVVTTFADYRDAGGIKFPMKIGQTAAGAMTLDLTVTDVKPNAPVDATVPENVAKWSERVTAERAADGVWFLAGGSHNSVAIEMADHMILVEAPLDDGRASAVIEEVRKLGGGKPLRTVINSHNHFDHAGGLRAAAAAGASIVTQANSKAYYEKVFANPNRIAPDRLAKSGRTAKVIGVADKLVLRDARRTVEVHRLRDSVHGDAMLMVYLPAEKMLIEADVFTPGPPNSPPLTGPNAGNVLGLVKNIEDLKLAVDQVLPLHGRMVPGAELRRTAGR